MNPAKYIGSNEQLEIVLKGKYISERHAALIFEKGKVCIEDLGSTFGTFVNGVKINEKTRLISNDKVKIGTHLLHWEDYILEDAINSRTSPIYIRDLFLPFGSIDWKDYKIFLLLIFGAIIVIPFGVPTVLLYLKNYFTRHDRNLRIEIDIWQYYEPLVIILLIICGYIFLNLSVKVLRGMKNGS